VFYVLIVPSFSLCKDTQNYSFGKYYSSVRRKICIFAQIIIQLDKNRTYWLSYDLRVGGDYEHLFQWLDDHNALPCGNSVAMIHYTTRKKDIYQAFADDLTKKIGLNPENVLYIIRKSDSGEIKGGFFEKGNGSYDISD